MNLSDFEVYCRCLAIKQHFTSSYDYFKYQGKVSAKLETFEARKDKYFYKRLGRRYNETDLVDFLVANFKADAKPWIGELLTNEADTHYKEYQRRFQSLGYIFKEELDKLGSLKGKFSGDFPIIMRAYLQNDISLETLIILDMILNFRGILDVRLQDDFEWPLISKKMTKLGPFLYIDTKKMGDILKAHEKGLLNNA